MMSRAGARSDVQGDAQKYGLGLQSGSVVRVLSGAGEADCPERKIVLGEHLFRGNRGRIFAVDGDEWSCVKVFNTPTRALGEKVREEARKLACGEVSPRAAAWPRGLVVSPSGEVVGYLMDRLRGEPLSRIASDMTAGLAERAAAAAGYARRLSELHGTVGTPPENTFVVGDAALSNAIVDRGRTSEARLVDVDAFQVAARRGGRRVLFPVKEIHDPSPETVGGNLGRKALSTRHDNYLCAVICFELLLGCDPLGSEEGDDDPDARERAVAERSYPYLASVGSGALPAPEEIVGGDVAELFVRAFTGPYDQIPTCREWARALESLAKAPVERCPKCGAERLRGASGDCPWCRRVTTDRTHVISTARTDRTRVAPTPAPDPVAASGASPSAGRTPPSGGPRWRQVLLVLLALLVLMGVTDLVLLVNREVAPLVFVAGLAVLVAAFLLHTFARGGD